VYLRRHSSTDGFSRDAQPWHPDQSDQTCNRGLAVFPARHGVRWHGSAGIRRHHNDVDGPVTSAPSPAHHFETGTTSSRIERLRVNSTGEIGVEEDCYGGCLADVNAGRAKSYTGTLPIAAIQPARSSTFRMRGGAVLAYSDGLNWRRVN